MLREQHARAPLDEGASAGKGPQPMTIDAYVDEKRRLEESLRESREQLEEAVGDLKQAARETLTPGEVVARRPYLWLCGAFALGLFLGRRSHRSIGGS